MECRQRLSPQKIKKFCKLPQQILEFFHILPKHKGTKLSMFLIPVENLALDFQSGGYISTSYKGRVMVKLANYSSKSIQLQSGTPIGYLVMQPYSLENN